MKAPMRIIQLISDFDSLSDKDFALKGFHYLVLTQRGAVAKR